MKILTFRSQMVTGPGGHEHQLVRIGRGSKTRFRMPNNGTRESTTQETIPSSIKGSLASHNQAGGETLCNTYGNKRNKNSTGKRHTWGYCRTEPTKINLKRK